MTPTRAVLDEEITEQVEARLRKAEHDRFTTIDVETVGGVVCLTGTVSNVTEHGEAERQARSVDGVQNVVNHLRIPIAQ